MKQSTEKEKKGKKRGNIQNRERFEMIDGLIIKSVPSPLFSELLKLEKVFYKSENGRNPLKTTGSSSVIKSSQLCAR